MYQENNLIRAKNQKENITLGFREIQLPNFYEQMQVHQQEKLIRSRVLLKNSDIANEIARKFVFKFKTLWGLVLRYGKLALQLPFLSTMLIALRLCINAI